MNTTRWMRIVAIAAAAAAFTGTAIANETESGAKGDQSATDVNANSAARLGPDQSAVPHRGDLTAQHGSDNSAAQLGTGLNGNPGAQLNNETQATSAPPADSDGNTPEQPVTTSTDTGTKSHD